MQLNPELLSAAMLWLSWALAVPVAAFALAASGLGRLREDRVGLHLFAGSVVALIGGVSEPGGIWAGAIPSLPAFLLMVGFSEGFINGAVVTMVLVLRPAWLIGYSRDYERPGPA